jgi:tetratricopeptide (TPR) repeat protein
MLSVAPPADLGVLDWAEGRDQEAEQRLEETLALAQEYGNPHLANGALMMLSERDLVAGRAGAAYARLAPLVDGPRRAIWAISSLLAWAQLELGEIEQATALAEDTIVMARSTPSRLTLVDALRVQAMIQARQGRWEEAAAALDEALPLARAMPCPYAELKALWVYGQLESARGNPGAARERYEQALAICDRLGEGLYRPRIEQDRDRISQSVR